MTIQHLNCGLIEVKSLDNTDGVMRFTGYGSVFGNVDSYGDVIDKGAFKKTLSEAKKSGIYPAMLSQHGGWGISADDLTPIGVWETLEEDEKGLRLDGILADTQRGIDMYKLMKMQPRPAINGLSIGYIAKKFTVGTKPEEPRRKLHEVELIEVSPVTFPANTLARVDSVKSAGGWTLRDLEHALRDVGMSQSEAKRFMAEGYKGIATLRDVGDDGHSSGDSSAELSEIKKLLQRNIETLTA